MLTKDKFALNKETWCGLNRPDLSEKESDIVIFGIPFDKGVSYRGGANLGPSTLRENTLSSTPFTENFESMEGLTVFDGGDFTGEDREALFLEIQNYVAELVRQGKFFTMVGGDHSITIPVQRGVNDGVDQSFGIIHIDAHFDLCDTLGGDKLSHGSTERRALELTHIDGVENIYFVGIRSIEHEEYQFKKDHPIQVKSAKECHLLGIEHVGEQVISAMQKFNKIYLTIDIDCLDPGFAAGTGTPQFGGLYSRQLLTLLEMLFDKLNIIGFDVVEVAPPLDPALTSMFAARKIITECWGYQSKKIGKL